MGRFCRSVSFEHSPKGGPSQELLRRKTEQWQGEKRCSDKENNVTVTRMRTSLERMMVLIFGFSLGFLLHPMLPLSPKVSDNSSGFMTNLLNVTSPKKKDSSLPPTPPSPP